MSGKYLGEFILSGLGEKCARLTVIKGPGIEAESSLLIFRGEKRYHKNKEAVYISSLDAINSGPFRQWCWYLKRFMRYHATILATSHFH